MSRLDQTFNVADLPESDSFEPIPAGTYTAQIADAELKATKAGTGQYIKLRLDITGPTHQGRVVFANLNIRNPNETAERIGRQQLGDVMRAIGLSQVQDTDQLVGGALKIKVTVRPPSDGYDASNDVKSYSAIGGSKPPMPQAAAPKPASSAPWAKKAEPENEPAIEDDSIPF